MQQKELRAAGIPVDVPAVALQSVNQKGIAAFFSKQRSALSSMASTYASSTTSSSTDSRSQRIAQLLAGSELDVEEKSFPSSVDFAAVNSYDSMSSAQLRACCGKKQGNSIAVVKKDHEGRWKPKSKNELISELKNAAMLRGKPQTPEQLDPAIKIQRAQKRQVPHNKAKDAERKTKVRKAAPRKHKAGVMHKMCRASRTVATISSQGTWCLAAEQIAIAEGNVAETPSFAVASPAYAAFAPR
jgi:hypothetical protein